MDFAGGEGEGEQVGAGGEVGCDLLDYLGGGGGECKHCGVVGGWG